VLLLLQFGQNDNDDEVRDRISLYCSVLTQSLDESRKDVQGGYQALMSADMPFSLDAMYDCLIEHVSSDRKGELFDFGNLPSDEAYSATMKAQAALQGDKKKPGVSSKPAAGKPGEPPQKEADQRASASAELTRVLGEIVQDAEIGPLQHTCRPKPLTESEAEYTVQVIKHIFKDHLVLEMYVSNTVQGITLENVEVRLTGLQPSWVEIAASSIPKLEYGQQASAHVVLRKAGGAEVAGAVAGKFGTALHFLVKEEGDDLGYEDDYPVEAVVVTTGDYMFPRPLQQGQFKSVWEQLTAQGVESTQKLSLNFRSLEAAVEAIINTLNMEPCDKTGKVEPGVRGHTLLMSGTFLGGQMCLVRALVGMDPERGCVAKLSCKAKSAEVCDVVTRALM